ncbi:MAG: hypothetical protein GC158_13080 [Cyanobacteria bacterium RI_101]|nr:hypothetical protein [Cyanobacteria bacterium RI_101]
MPKKRWVYNPPKPTVPPAEKQLITQKINEFLETEFKPQHVKSQPDGSALSYCVDIFGKWYRNYFYFCAVSKMDDSVLDRLKEELSLIDPELSEMEPDEKNAEEKFARLEYVGEDSFNLAYMRHTGKWWETSTGLTLEQCLNQISISPHYHPQ